MERKRLSSLPTGVTDVSIYQDDGQIEAMYFRFSHSKVAKSVEVGTSGAVIDLDKSGKLVGIELLEPCRISLVKKFIKKEMPQISEQFSPISRLQEVFA